YKFMLLRDQPIKKGPIIYSIKSVDKNKSNNFSSVCTCQNQQRQPLRFLAFAVRSSRCCGTPQQKTAASAAIS
ncbi:hypothetical protein KTC77_28270, partial [Klebsiella pneumoniae]|nr:hypothetical protein [Klebsiella pneumoniae]